MPTNNPTTRHAAGFSMIELLTVIAIVAVIAGLLLGGITALKGGAKESQARTILTNLVGNAGMYETKAGNPIKHLEDKKLMKWDNPKRCNAPGFENQTKVITAGYNNPENDENPNYPSTNRDNNYYMERANLFIERFVWAANQIPQIRENLPALGEAFDDTDGDGFLEVVDPWGNPIAYAWNVTHTPGSNEDDDFLPEYQGVFFASAGKDQKWGVPKKRGDFPNDAAWQDYKGSDEYKHTLDNLYSFDMDRAAATRGD